MLVDKMNGPSLAVPPDLSESALIGFDRRLNDLLKSDPGTVSVDSSIWQQVTSSHIHVLWLAYKQCSDCGAQMQLVSPTPELVRVLRVLDLYDVFIGIDLEKTSEVSVPAPPDVQGQRLEYADDITLSIKSIDNALAEFMKFLNSVQMPDATAFELRTLFYEVATNIRVHGHMEEGELVVFTCHVEEAKITLAFADSGQPFDPTTTSADIDVLSAVANRRTRGFGIMMIRKMADRVSYVRKQNAVNVLTLEKTWGF